MACHCRRHPPLPSRSPSTGGCGCCPCVSRFLGHVCPEQYFTELTELRLSVTVTHMTRVHAVCINKKFNAVCVFEAHRGDAGRSRRSFILPAAQRSVAGRRGGLPVQLSADCVQVLLSRALLYSRWGLYSGTQSTRARLRTSLQGIGRARCALTSVTSVCFPDLSEP